MSMTVIREVASGVWTFSAPFSRFGVPIGGRSTAISLQEGGVWVLASTPLDIETKTKLDELGHVKYIVSPDAVHHLYLSEFKRTYPSAKLIATAAAIQRHGDPKQFDGAWGRDEPIAKYGFEREIDVCYFSGHHNREVAFLHRASKSLIQGDLLFNLPAKEQYSKSKASGSFLGLAFQPQGWLHRKLTWTLGMDKEAMKRDVMTVSGWDFDRIIPCHGDVIENDGKKAWNDAYVDYLKPS
ncbi:hypothetical protein CPB83DRAFT_851435 [Crepidotus variabilis]|uniref:DUF4336 domain-containing protein n=1 Tax=Crepidotus variabilis TaxID=179855 RepID=A0A9P6JRL0_9AGAR|nr:hypothetical protein CPB83DRAFT_851435 [Crepidotus variabilis]